jgi:hypothetical protein
VISLGKLRNVLKTNNKSCGGKLFTGCKSKNIHPKGGRLKYVVEPVQMARRFKLLANSIQYPVDKG